ncbi:hypothetical protein [Thermanaeromonas toyohensis]|uniref:hypothetical protein n=1 Tax=Thermanaeromonas toyohensis TaxID=161154 RepID=UPI001560CB68|nr:hypothetical protein [Thermanaeromonas toyohensis]
MKPLGRPEEVLRLVLKLADRAQKYGIPWDEAFTVVLAWANKCQRYGCIIELDKYDRVYYSARRGKGLCVDCGKPAPFGRARCEACLERMRYYARKWRERHNA